MPENVLKPNPIFALCRLPTALPVKPKPGERSVSLSCVSMVWYSEAAGQLERGNCDGAS